MKNSAYTYVPVFNQTTVDMKFTKSISDQILLEYRIKRKRKKQHQ